MITRENVSAGWTRVATAPVAPLGALVPVPRPRGLALPRQHRPDAIAVSYARGLRRIACAPAWAALRPLLDALPGLVAGARAERQGARGDAGEGGIARGLLARARASFAAAVRAKDLQDVADDFARRTETFQRLQLGAQVRAALGADVFASDRRLPAMRQVFVSENVALIKSIPDRFFDDVEEMVAGAVTGGRRHENLAGDIRERFEISERRANLIARDQVGKFYGQVNAYRQRELGVRRFVWRTVNDPRVRHEHADREGKTYSYDDPPGGELPGEAVNCRCWAEPVLDDVFEASEGAGAPLPSAPVAPPEFEDLGAIGAFSLGTPSLVPTIVAPRPPPPGPPINAEEVAALIAEVNRSVQGIAPMRGASVRAWEITRNPTPPSSSLARLSARSSGRSSRPSSATTRHTRTGG